MSCRAELRGLGAVTQALRARGGRVFAISVDPPADHAKLVASERLPFMLLSDERHEAIESYGLVHEVAPGQDIALPAQILVRRDGSVAWSHVSRAVQDRA